MVLVRKANRPRIGNSSRKSYNRHTYMKTTSHPQPKYVTYPLLCFLSSFRKLVVATLALNRAGILDTFSIYTSLPLEVGIGVVNTSFRVGGGKGFFTRKRGVYLAGVPSAFSLLLRLRGVVAVVAVARPELLPSVALPPVVVFSVLLTEPL